MDLIVNHVMLLVKHVQELQQHVLLVMEDIIYYQLHALLNALQECMVQMVFANLVLEDAHLVVVGVIVILAMEDTIF